MIGEHVQCTLKCLQCKVFCNISTWMDKLFSQVFIHNRIVHHWVKGNKHYQIFSLNSNEYALKVEFFLCFLQRDFVLMPEKNEKNFLIFTHFTSFFQKNSKIKQIFWKFLGNFYYFGKKISFFQKLKMKIVIFQFPFGNQKSP